MHARTSRTFRIAAALAALLLGAGPVVGLEPEELRFLAELRARRLFESAEYHCRLQLEKSEATAAERAEWTIELARTYAEHAMNVPPQQREPLWRAAREAVAELARREPLHPRLPVVRTQDVLTQLALGELARQEAEAALEPEPRLAEAREHLRGAIRGLEQLDREIATEHLPRRLANRNPGPEELSLTELHALQANVQFQLARGLRNQALTYPAGSDDRIALLSQAVERLTPLASKDDAPLRLPAALDLIRCRRLLGIAGRRDARRLLEAFGALNPPPKLQLEARAEAVRLELEDKRFEAALQLLAEGRRIRGETSAEFDFAHLETYIGLWQNAAEGDEAAVEKWRKAATDAMRSLGREYGEYWGRRAQLLVARASGDSAGDREVLLLTAKRLYLQQQWDAAIDAYAQAAAQAEAEGEPAAAIPYVQAAAQIELEQGRRQAAEDRLRDSALRLAAVPQAAPLHWTSALLAAQAVREDPSLLPHYEARLAEHAEKFASGAHAEEARFWLGRLRQQQGNFLGAAEAYKGIRGGDDAEAAARLEQATGYLAQCWQAELERREQASEPTGDVLLEAVTHFDELHQRTSDNAVLQPASRAAVLAAARLRLRYRSAEAATVERQLEAALAGDSGPDAWQTSARVLLVSARALQPDRRAEALAALRQITAAEPEELLLLLGRLEEVGQGASAEVRRSLAELQLAGTELLEPHRERLSAGNRIQLDMQAAAALTDAGRAAEALTRYERLAAAAPDNGEVQHRYAAALLAASTNKAALEQALAQWRLVLARSEPQTERWYAAKYAVASIHHRLGDSAEAAKMIRIAQTLYPELGGPVWKTKFTELLAECER